MANTDPSAGESQPDATTAHIYTIISTLGGEALAGPSSSGEAYRRLPPVESLPECGLLVGENVAATPGAAEIDPAVELKRTKLTIDCAIDAFHGNGRRFPGLTEEERQHLFASVRAAIPDEETLDAFTFLLLTHDVGKNEEVVRAVGASGDVDHDEVYSRLLTDPTHEVARRRLLPSFDLLSPEGQRLVVGAAKISSNYPQSLQGEAPGATLADFHKVTDRQVKMLDILKAKFDIFGAAGHVNSEVSLTATSAVYRRMRNLDTALLDLTLPSPEARNNAFLDTELEHFMGARPDEAQNTTEELAAYRALARLACQLRVADKAEFSQMLTNFNSLHPVSKTVLVHELNRPTRATLAYYSPVLMRSLTEREGGAFALEYLAHILQEAHIADQKARREGLPGISTVKVENLVRDIRNGTFNPRNSAVRFRTVDGALEAVPAEVTLDNIDGLPEFSRSEQLRGKRIVVIGEGGGSDGIQAAMAGRLLAAKYGCEVAAVVSVRNAERQLANTGEQVGVATKRITTDTQPVGDWRFLEKIPTEDDPDTPMYVLNTTDPSTVQSDVAALLQHTGANAVVGVDTGGDSLFRTEHAHFSAYLPTDITPDHDYNVLKGLNGLAQSHDIPVLSVIVAPGVDTPPYAREMLDIIGAERLPLDEDEAGTIQDTYARWGMDGSGSEQGRYGKTPLAWLHALAGRTGLQRLDLPRANVTSVTNPWRAFTVITPSMAGIVVSELRSHFAAIRRS